MREGARLQALCKRKFSCYDVALSGHWAQPLLLQKREASYQGLAFEKKKKRGRRRELGTLL